MLIISASNIARVGEASRSLAVARRLAAAVGGAEILDLRELRLTPCDMCEACARSGRCVHDDGFNAAKEALDRHDTVAVICPHYAGIPSKLVALFEKLEEGAYLAYCSGGTASGAAGSKKRFGAIVHGGMTEGFKELYRENLYVPLRNMARSLGWSVVGDGHEAELCFGVLRYRREPDPGSVCFAKDDDEAGADAAVARLAALFAVPGRP